MPTSAWSAGLEELREWFNRVAPRLGRGTVDVPWRLVSSVFGSVIVGKNGSHVFNDNIPLGGLPESAIHVPENDRGSFNVEIPLAVFPNDNGSRQGTTNSRVRERLNDFFRLLSAVVRAAISRNRTESIQIPVDVDIESSEGGRSMVLDHESNTHSKLNEIILATTGASSLFTVIPYARFPTSTSPPTSPALNAAVGLDVMAFGFSLASISLRQKKPRASRILAKLGATAAAALIIGLSGMFLPPNIQWISWVAALITATVLAFI